MGDFNEITCLYEKEGGLIWPRVQVVGFQNILADCGLSDLGGRGNKFNWQNSCTRWPQLVGSLILVRQWCIY